MQVVEVDGAALAVDVIGRASGPTVLPSPPVDPAAIAAPTLGGED